MIVGKNNVLNILIIDDNHDLADGLDIIFQDEGHQVTTAYNGNDGIETYIAGKFDFVLIDVKLPDMNGIEVFQKIHREAPGVRALLMTGYRIEQILAEVVEGGEVKILRDPIEFNRVLDIINQIQNAGIVLIENDAPEFADSLSLYLNDYGCNTLLAKNYQDAVGVASSIQLDVLVLGMQMPIMYGLEVYLELKQRGSAVKTIIVTGITNEEPDAVDSLRAVSVTGCLFKPFSPEYMLQAIDRIMGA